MGKGKLIKVQISPGRFVKVYEQDAINQGMIEKPKKKKAPAGDKMRRPVGDKKSRGAGGQGAEEPGSKGAGEQGAGEQIQDDLMSIEGVGPATERALQARGIRTFEKLRNAKNLDFLNIQVQEAIERWKDDDSD